MAAFKVILIAIIAVLTFANATTTSAPAPATPSTYSSCPYLPGGTSSAVVYGSTYSVPVNYDDCPEAIHACWEAGRLCGNVFGIYGALPDVFKSKLTISAPVPFTSVSVTVKTIVVTVPAESSPAAASSTDAAVNQLLAESASFTALFAALLGAALL